MTEESDSECVDQNRENLAAKAKKVREADADDLADLDDVEDSE